ncbi:hypothetical protein BS78_04G156600 [Paspalum vaginatum]|nr:hypothetical protein BS78_04G156600 [Paspalum vaginatum]
MEECMCRAAALLIQKANVCEPMQPRNRSNLMQSKGLLEKRMQKQHKEMTDSPAKEGHKVLLASSHTTGGDSLPEARTQGIASIGLLAFCHHSLYIVLFVHNCCD